MANKPKELSIDKRTMHHIQDIAHGIWMDTRKPNGNLIMFEALKQYLERQGLTVPYKVVMDDNSSSS